MAAGKRVYIVDVKQWEPKVFRDGSTIHLSNGKWINVVGSPAEVRRKLDL